MGSNSSEQTAGNRRFAWTVILAILAVLVIILGGAYTVWRLSARESYETSHPQRAVNVSLTAEDYEPSEDGPTPLRVKGTTSDGEEVNGYALVKTELCNLMLEPGSYEIGVAGPVIGPDGTLYRAPEGVLKITVPASGATTPIGFELTVADPDSVTATDAYEAYDTLLRAGADDEMSRELRAAANDRYQTTEQEEPDEKDQKDQKAEPAAPHDAEGQGAPSRDSEAQGSEPQASSFPFTPTADSVPLEGADEQAFVLMCAEALGVPTDQPGITYELTDQYYWEGGALDLLTIVFRGPDGYQASGECTVEDGPIKGLFGWNQV